LFLKRNIINPRNWIQVNNRAQEIIQVNNRTLEIK